jgi:hypothetical protein
MQHPVIRPLSCLSPQAEGIVGAVLSDIQPGWGCWSLSKEALAVALRLPPCAIAPYLQPVVELLANDGKEFDHALEVRMMTGAPIPSIAGAS